jgi:hypothetical protein
MFGVAGENYVKNNEDAFYGGMCKCDNSDFEKFIIRVFSKNLKCERNKEAVKAAVKEWHRCFEIERKEREREDKEYYEITKNVYIEGYIKIGVNSESNKFVYGNENTIKVKTRQERYSRRFSFPKIVYRIEGTCKKGWTLHAVGGVLTFIRGTEIKREGQICEWVVQGQVYTDTYIKKGYLVRGEHIEAKSLKEARKINARNRKAAAEALIAERAKINARNNKLDKVVVTFEDSLNCGNCEPGTESFRKRVSLEKGEDVEMLNAKEVLAYGKKFGLEMYAKRAVASALKREKNNKK